MSNNKSNGKMDLIIKTYAEVCGLTSDDVLGMSRKTKIITVRYLIWRSLREDYLLRVEQISQLFGCGHSAIVKGVQRVSELIEVRDRFVMPLLEKINSVNPYASNYSGYIVGVGNFIMNNPTLRSLPYACTRRKL